MLFAHHAWTSPHYAPIPVVGFSGMIAKMDDSNYEALLRFYKLCRREQVKVIGYVGMTICFTTGAIYLACARNMNKGTTSISLKHMIRLSDYVNFAFACGPLLCLGCKAMISSYYDDERMTTNKEQEKQRRRAQ